MGFRAHPLIREHVIAEAEARGCSQGDFIAALIAEHMARPGLARMPVRRTALPQQATLDEDMDREGGMPLTG